MCQPNPVSSEYRSSSSHPVTETDKKRGANDYDPRNKRTASSTDRFSLVSTEESSEADFVQNVAHSALLLTTHLGPQTPGVIAKVSYEASSAADAQVLQKISLQFTLLQPDHATLSKTIQHPTEIALRADGNIYVLNVYTNHIEIYNREGIFQNSIKHLDSPQNKLCYLQSIALNSRGELYVFEYLTNSVAVFSSEGNFLRYAKNPANKGDEDYNHRIIGMSIDAADNFYLVDGREGKVKAFNAAGDLLHCFGSRGSNPEQLNNPLGLAIDNEREIIYLLSSKGIQAFSLTGEFLQLYKLDGFQVYFGNIYDLALDKEGNLLLLTAEKHHQTFEYREDHNSRTPLPPNNNNVKVYDRLGNHLRTIRLDSALSPQRIAINDEGHILITDQETNSLFVVK